MNRWEKDYMLEPIDPLSLYEEYHEVGTGHLLSINFQYSFAPTTTCTFPPSYSVRFGHAVCCRLPSGSLFRNNQQPDRVAGGRIQHH